MDKYFKIFWSIYLIEFITPILLFIFYLTSTDLIFLFKIPQVLYLLLILIFHFRHSLIATPFLYIFFFFGLFSLIYGLSVNRRIDMKFFAHIYYNIVPILGTSFGIHFAKKYDIVLKSFIHKVMRISFWFTTFILFIYFYLHFITMQIPYWGFGTDMHLIIPFLFAEKRYLLVFLGLVLVFFSGKRATTLNVLLVLIMNFWSQIFTFNLKRMLIWGIALILISAIIINAYNQGYLSRFEATFNYDADDEYSMTVATSGRWQEVTGILDYLNATPYKWIIGAGFGGSYLWFAPLVGFDELKHYAHFSPFTYLFIYGLPFTMTLYSILIFLIVKGFKYVSNQFYVIFVVLVFGSFFGANLLVDIKIWFFIGIAWYLITGKNKNPLILN